MPGSDRGKQSAARLIGTIVTAVLGVGLYWSMFYSAGYGSGYNERKAEVESSHYAADTPQQIERKCSAKTGVAARECITEIIEAERESQRNESDLAAQWKAADWVLWAGVIAGAQLMATIIGLYFIKRTLDATIKAVEDTGKATLAMERQNDIAEAAQRPWIKISAKLLSIEVLERRAIKLDWSVDFENVGKMVATNFQPLVKLIPMGVGFFDQMETHMDSFPGDLQEMEAVLIPGDINAWKGQSGFAIEYLPWTIKEGCRKDCVLMLIAMVRYRFPGEETWRVSMQGFAIAEKIESIDDCHFRYDFPDDLSLANMHVRKLGRSRAT